MGRQPQPKDNEPVTPGKQPGPPKERQSPGELTAAALSGIRCLTAVSAPGSGGKHVPHSELDVANILRGSSRAGSPATRAMSRNEALQERTATGGRIVLNVSHENQVPSCTGFEQSKWGELFLESCWV